MFLRHQRWNKTVSKNQSLKCMFLFLNQLLVQRQTMLMLVRALRTFSSLLVRLMQVDTSQSLTPNGGDISDEEANHKADAFLEKHALLTMTTPSQQILM